jgi:hypothetical protein
MSSLIDRAQFEALGIAMVRRVFTQPEIEVFRRIVNSDMANRAPWAQCGAEMTHYRVPNLTGRHGVFRELACDSKISSIACEAIGPAIQLHHSKLHRGSPPTSWHRDLCSYPHTNSKLIACELYLDHVDQSHGALEVCPRSHRAVLPTEGRSGYLGQVIRDIPPQVLATALVLSAGPGDVTVHHSLVMHRALPCIPGKSRDVLIFVYRSADSAMLVPNTTEEASYGEAIGRDDLVTVTSEPAACVLDSSCLDDTGKVSLCRREFGLSRRPRQSVMM